MRSLLAIFVASVALLGVSPPADAIPVTLSQDQLLTADDATTDFGGNGQIVSRTPDGDGVLFELEASTIDFGKVALRLLLDGGDLSAYDAFGLHFDIVLAPNPIVVTSYVQRSGRPFAEAVSPDVMQGDALDVVLPLTEPGYDDVAYLGFQYFAAGGLEEPPPQTVLLRVTPLAGAETVPVAPVPEAGTLLLLILGGAVCVCCLGRSG